MFGVDGWIRSRLVQVKLIIAVTTRVTWLRSPRGCDSGRTDRGQRVPDLVRVRRFQLDILSQGGLTLAAGLVEPSRPAIRRRESVMGPSHLPPQARRLRCRERFGVRCDGLGELPTRGECFAKTVERLGLAVPYAGLPVQSQRLAVVVDRFGVPALQPVHNAEVR